MDIMMTYEKFQQRSKRYKSDDFIENISNGFKERSEEYICDLIVKEFTKTISEDFKAERKTSDFYDKPSYLRSGTYYPPLLNIFYDDYKITCNLNSTRAKISCYIWNVVLDERTNIDFSESTSVDLLMRKMRKAITKITKEEYKNAVNSKKRIDKFNL